MVEYHDVEWGVPVVDDGKLFEMLTLEGAQAGLSWSTILHKREGYRKCFAGFELEKVARFTARRQAKLLEDASIVRNRAKIASTVTNARAVLKLAETYGSFARWLWDFVDGEPVVGSYRSMKQVPAKTELSDRLSKALKKHGFKFVGSTITYAFMQAAGLVNDHTHGCFRRQPCIALGRRLRVP